jgi:hypothetical protein
VILPPVELPLTAERRERAVAALSQLLTAHGGSGKTPMMVGSSVSDTR